jgi:hypothetical protein
LGEDRVVFIDCQIRRHPERATQCPILGAGPSHDKYRLGIVTPGDKLARAIDERLA